MALFSPERKQMYKLVVNGVVGPGREVSCTEPQLLRNCRWITAGPTTGKTYFQSMASCLGVSILDTDSVVLALTPWWFEDHTWRDATPEMNEKLDFIVGSECARLLHANPQLILVSNRWGVRFRQAVGQVVGEPGGDLAIAPLLVFRESAQEISDISSERGAAAGSRIPLRLARKWVDSALALAPILFKRTIWLPDSEGDGPERIFLSDVVLPSYIWLGSPAVAMSMAAFGDLVLPALVGAK